MKENLKIIGSIFLGLILIVVVFWFWNKQETKRMEEYYQDIKPCLIMGEWNSCEQLELNKKLEELIE